MTLKENMTLIVNMTLIAETTVIAEQEKSDILQLVCIQTNCTR